MRGEEELLGREERGRETGWGREGEKNGEDGLGRDGLEEGGGREEEEKKGLEVDGR